MFVEVPMIHQPRALKNSSRIENGKKRILFSKIYNSGYVFNREATAQRVTDRLEAIFTRRSSRYAAFEKIDCSKRIDILKINSPSIDKDVGELACKGAVTLRHISDTIVINDGGRSPYFAIQANQLLCLHRAI